MFPPGANSQVALVLEHDAWDWNAGAQITWGHLSAGLYLTELEETKGVPDSKPLANDAQFPLGDILRQRGHERSRAYTHVPTFEHRESA